MTAITDTPDAPRAARRPQVGNPVLRWLRTNLFSSIPNGILSVVLLAISLVVLVAIRRLAS